MRICYRELSEGVHVDVRSEATGTVIYLALGLTHEQRRAAISKARQAARVRRSVALPLLPLGLAITADRTKIMLRSAVAAARVHPVALALPVVIVIFVVALYAFTASVTIPQSGRDALGPGAPRAGTTSPWRLVPVPMRLKHPVAPSTGGPVAPSAGGPVAVAAAGALARMPLSRARGAAMPGGSAASMTGNGGDGQQHPPPTPLPVSSSPDTSPSPSPSPAESPSPAPAPSATPARAPSRAPALSPSGVTRAGNGGAACVGGQLLLQVCAHASGG